MSQYIILMGAGSGERMGNLTPKQFIDINGLPLIIHTYNKIKLIKDTNVIIVLPSKRFSHWKNIIKKYVNEDVNIISGGSTRKQSVTNGIESIRSKNGYVAIHDGVRPLASSNLFKKLFLSAKKYGNAVPFIKSVNSLREIDGKKNKAVDRSKIVQIQTPQVFKINEIFECLDRSKEETFTDEASLLEKFGYKINLVEGEEENVKVTTKKDLNYLF